MLSKAERSDNEVLHPILSEQTHEIFKIQIKQSPEVPANTRNKLRRETVSFPASFSFPPLSQSGSSPHLDDRAGEQVVSPATENSPWQHSNSTPKATLGP